MSMKIETLGKQFQQELGLNFKSYDLRKFSLLLVGNSRPFFLNGIHFFGPQIISNTLWRKEEGHPGEK